MARDLSNRVIVVTGASSGIGEATALACAQAGMDVVIAARREQRLADLAERIRQSGRRALPVVCDVDQDQDVAHLFQETQKEFGRLDCMFANAGRGLMAPVMDTSVEMFKNLFDTNFLGTIRCIQAAISAMRQSPDGSRGRHILICSSCVSEISLPNYGAYAATKAAQDSVAQSLRAELAEEGIYVSSVHPVTTRTEFFDRAKEQSPLDSKTHQPLRLFTQNADHVAQRIVRCLRKPCPEVWPHRPTRYALAFLTAFPSITAWAMRRMAK